MNTHRTRDEESADGQEIYTQPIRPYHDDSADSDDSDTVGPDAPLRASQSQRPSTDFDDPDRPNEPTWLSSIAARAPEPVKRAWRATVKWVKGPQPPRQYTITPFFPDIQHIPINLLERYTPKKAQRFWLLMAVYALWLLSFSLVLWRSSFAAQIPGHGSPVRLSCSARYWSDGNGCGINGDQCRPFSNATLAFRCPAECHKIEVLNPHAVGDQEIVYKPLVIGGPVDYQTGFDEELVGNAVYRGDSFICASAVHAGFINDREGGCGVLSLTGEQPSFPVSKAHGISSIGFDSYFPQSFGFMRGTTSQCKDLRWPALIVTVVFTTLLSLFTTSPGVFFWSMFVALFFTTALSTDPPQNTTYNSLLSIAFGRFLPAAFCAAITYKYTVTRSLNNLTAQVEKTVLWLGAAWVGALNNFTFDRIPIQRLTPHDIKAQPGAVPALICVVLSIFFIALGQAWSFRVEGRMPRYLVIYSIFVFSLLFMLAIPGLNLRIHHYILALLLLPGTSFQNRPSLLYQGLLVGLFVNGIARWGFDSILQTPGELLEGAQQGSLLPAVSIAAIGGMSNITFNLGPLPRWDPKVKVLYDGISVLVNDIERFRGYRDDRTSWDNYTPGGNYTWTWNRHHLGKEIGFEVEAEAEAEVMSEYFRFAYMAGSQVADFTKGGVWDARGRWRQMETGPSRRRLF